MNFRQFFTCLFGLFTAKLSIAQTQVELLEFRTNTGDSYVDVVIDFPGNLCKFIETDKGYQVRAASGKYKGWVIGVDDSAKTRPEGPNLTVTPALRLAKSATKNSFWKLILTEQGLVLEATSGKYKGWFWDFGGGDPSHEESGRQVAINVLLAEKVVAGSYFEVKKTK